MASAEHVDSVKEGVPSVQVGVFQPPPIDPAPTERCEGVPWSSLLIRESLPLSLKVKRVELSN